MDKFVERQEVLKLLNAPTKEERLANLVKVLENEKVKPEEKPQFANNHIHTIYSFSPYSPTAAVFCARDEGLQTVGIMDHDSIAGAAEFREAGKIAGVGTTCGMECRSDVTGTWMEGKKLNNPDQESVAYMTIHSVPADQFEKLNDYFIPLREKRNVRNRKIVDNINKIMEPHGVVLDFEKDVLPLSQFANGGSVTERHVLCGLSLKVIEKAGKENCAAFVEEKIGIKLSEKQKAQLSDPQNPHFVYDLLGVMKAEMVEKVFVPATDELIPFRDLVKLANEVGGYLCYPYLGDVTDSVTGDKKAAKFEDDYLDDLVKVLKEEGVHGITYMPSRNTPAQLARVQDLCRKYDLIEISGEDVNSSRQSMICEKLEDPQFKHLVDAAWRLVERER